MKMFLSFESMNKSREYGGSDFLEFQFCRLPENAADKEKVNTDNLRFRLDDSLYVYDDVQFFNAYSHIFADGLYANLQRGVIDICGINYYDEALTEKILDMVMTEKPPCHDRLTEWLKKAREYNGFYILGM